MKPVLTSPDPPAGTYLALEHFVPEAGLGMWPDVKRRWWPLLKETFAAWSDDYAPSMGAAIAYYTMFSIAPLLVIVTAVTGLLFSREAVTGELFGQIRGLVGDDGAKAIEGLVQSASDPGEGAIAIIGGLLAILFGATGVFSEIQSAIDRIWEVPKRERAAHGGNLSALAFSPLAWSYPSPFSFWFRSL